MIVQKVIDNYAAGEFFRVPITGGSVKMEPLDLTVQGLVRRLSLNPDGRRLAFDVDRNDSTLRLWTPSAAR